MSIAAETVVLIDWSAVAARAHELTAQGMARPGQNTGTSARYTKRPTAVVVDVSATYSVPTGYAAIEFPEEPGKYWIIKEQYLTAAATSAGIGVTANAAFESAYGKILKIKVEAKGRVIAKPQTGGISRAIDATEIERSIIIEHEGYPPEIGTVLTLNILQDSDAAFIVSDFTMIEEHGVAKRSVTHIARKYEA